MLVVIMVNDIRNFNGLPYKRTTKLLTRSQAIAKAKQIRQIKGFLARIDTYKGGYAVWIHDERKPRTRKTGENRIVAPYSCPECGARIGETKDYEFHSGGRIECLQCGEIFEGKKRSGQKMKPLNIKIKKAKFKPLSSKKKAFESLDRSNKRSKFWGFRLDLINASAKWIAPNGDRYEGSVVLQYFNDYFEEKMEGREAIANGAYQVMFAVRMQGDWTGSNTMHVDPSYSSAYGDFKHGITVLKTAHRLSRDQESSDVSEFLYQHFAQLYGENVWDKFGH